PVTPAPAPPPPSCHSARSSPSRSSRHVSGHLWLIPARHLPMIRLPAETGRELTMSQASKQFESTLHERLKHSDIFRIYQEAFRTATGLPLRLVGADPDNWCLDENTVNRSPFCEALNLCKAACSACIETNRRLIIEASVQGPSTCRCFAGLTASAVPIRLGATIIGYLKTGQ